MAEMRVWIMRWCIPASGREAAYADININIHGAAMTTGDLPIDDEVVGMVTTVW